MKRVCLNALFLQPSLAGIGNYTYRLAEMLMEQKPDWEFSLLVSSGAAAHFAPLKPRLRIVEVRLRKRFLRLLYFHLVFPFRARRFDLLHSVGNMGLVLCPIPQVITLHDVYERVSPERFGWSKRWLMARLISASGDRAKAVLTGSENSRADIAKYYPRLARKLSVIHYGCKFPVLHGAAYAGRKHFAFVGTLEPGKNLPLVLRAFARAAASADDKLLIVGAPGWRQSEIPALIRSLGIASRVDLLGFVPDADLARVLASARALLQASTYEGFGLPVIEAMACGCPVICSRNSGLIEAGGDAALFFPTGDEAALIERMETLQSDPTLAEACMRRGLEHAERFTWKGAAEKTLAVYLSVLGLGAESDA